MGDAKKRFALIMDIFRQTASRVKGGMSRRSVKVTVIDELGEPSYLRRQKPSPVVYAVVTSREDRRSEGELSLNVPQDIAARRDIAKVSP